MPDGQILAFLGVSLLLTVTLSAEMALVTKHALGSGGRAAFQAMWAITTAALSLDPSRPVAAARR
jgi:hypothetical protein